MARKPSSIIRNALTAIGAKYQGGERAWLASKNPLALRQLDTLLSRIDEAELQDADVQRACDVWVKNWLFWIGNYRVQAGGR